MSDFLRIIMVNAVIIVTVTAIIIFLKWRGFRGRYDLQDQLLEDEREANATRSRDIEPEFFFTADTSAFPLQASSDPAIARKQQRVKDCAARKMLRFPKKRTNLELKHAYGVANFEKVAQFEENYHQYMASLVSLAEALPEEKDTLCLMEAVRDLGGEFRKAYEYLADHYAKNFNREQLQKLQAQAEATFADEGIKYQLTKYIMEKSQTI